MASSRLTSPAEPAGSPPLHDAAAEPCIAPNHFRDLVWHLARSELDSTHRLTTLGWLWPLFRQLAQLVILVFVFSRLIHLEIKDFPVFVFSGLIAWNWFSAGISRASTSLIDYRHLLFQPRFPARVVPVVAVVVPLLDVASALPVLLGMLVLNGGLTWSAWELPLFLALQLVMMTGLAWWLAAASVFFRDIPNLVGVFLLLLFYLTPVFYSHARIPSQYRWVLDLNPLTIIIDAVRAVLLNATAPQWGPIAVLCAVSLIVGVSGYVVFGRLQRRFVDYL